ncbi:MAG: bifunctional folylpolyglutamate synthase/dihydrofolate synthase [Lachnospiraceae bacterium]|nr:bifunctional folylpolyglutamate synthase/dihydrofolate synthase [Lachnospiraceae bacterium]
MKKFEDYEAAVSYIMGIPRFSAKNDPEITQRFLEYITAGANDGAVTQQVTIHVAGANDGTASHRVTIHVAGTNGKGSVCAFLESVYRKLGRKTGLFTSPHLVDIRERIKVNNEMISEEDFRDCAEYVIKNTVRFNKDNGETCGRSQGEYNIESDSEPHCEDSGGYHPSYFEFLFFMAVHYFEERGVETAIYETGLGGRLDATNSLTKDLSVITSIGMDHMEYLGHNIEEIAAEKAGIIKPGVPAVCIGQDTKVMEVMKKRAEEVGAPLRIVWAGEEDILRIHEKNIDFSYKYGYDSSAIFTVRTYAHYQVSNAALALCALQTLQGDRIVDDERVHEGIRDMYWPGRLEEVEDNIWVDGGHNVDGLKAMLESVGRDGAKGRRLLLFSAVADKEVSKMAGLLVGSGLFDEVGLCPISNARATDTSELLRIFENKTDGAYRRLPISVFDNIATAYRDMKGKLRANDRLYICGSLYLVGSIKELIQYD